MSQPAATVLKDIVGRHGVALLEDHRRCEACLRDTQLPRRDIIGLVAVLKSGLPARILQHRTSGLTAVAISNYAQQLADDTGLDLDLARGALQAWAQGLGVNVSDPPGIGERYAEPAPNPDPVPLPPPNADVARDVRWLPWTFAVLGLVLVGGQGFPDAALTLATFATGSLCVLAAAMLLRKVRWGKWPAVALSLAILVLVIASPAMFDAQLLAGHPIFDELLGIAGLTSPMIAAGLLAVVSLTGSLLWRPPDRQTGSLFGRAHLIAMAVLLAALWNVLMFGVSAGGTATAIRDEYLFHLGRFGWLWANLALSLILIWLAWSVLTGRTASLHRGLVASLLGACFVTGLLDQITAQAFGGHDYWPWPPDLARIVGMVTDLGAAALVILLGTHTAAAPVREKARA